MFANIVSETYVSSFLSHFSSLNSNTNPENPETDVGPASLGQVPQLRHNAVSIHASPPSFAWHPRNATSSLFLRRPIHLLVLSENSCKVSEKFHSVHSSIPTYVS